MAPLLLSSFLLLFFSSFNILGIKTGLLVNQVSFIIIGVLVFFLIKKIGRNFFRLNSIFFYWLFVLSLVVTYIIGFEARGSKRWIDLYFFNYQGSEVFKPFFILFLASFFSRNEKKLNSFKTFLISLIYMLVPALIIFKQPDLGNAIVYFFVYIVLVIFSDLPKKYIFYFIVLVLMTLPVFWLNLHDYQKDRILSFLNPHFDQQGTAYNMIQAMIAVGSGRFFGRGLGLGTQSKLFFLPENQTDFAFSSLVEQFGFFGGFVCLILYAIIILFLIFRAMKFYFYKEKEEKENFYYIIGFSSYFIFQTVVNIGMNLGIMPIAGVALPFISYGGSSIVALMIGIALLP